MANTYKTPGVYIEEISVFPPSIAAVETAIPAFIGFTEKAEEKNGKTLTNIPTRITSLLEYEQNFGKAQNEALSIDLVQKVKKSDNQILEATLSFNGTPPSLPKHYLYYSMQMFFENGGGPCYIVSIGNYSTAYKVDLFTKAIDILEKYDEPTLFVFPDACLGKEGDVGNIINKALGSCNKMQDRFTIADVYNAVPDGTDTAKKVNDLFRDKTSSDLGFTKYGAAYYPYLKTSLNFQASDSDIKVKTHKTISVKDDGSEEAPKDGPLKDKAISDELIKTKDTAVYNAVKEYIRLNAKVVLPPSGAIAGVYARTDRLRGVWKAPANTSVLRTMGPAIDITNDFNDGLNVDPSTGKSVNAIRAFSGKGTLVWGGRTLAGNDNEWRYVSVRRFFNMVEESTKKATSQFVFEANDANTWTKVRAMIENFLILQWRAGALAGAKPEHAFFVKVGLNQTMTADDILNGYMIVEIGMAVVRPAEFIVLRFSHKMQES